MRNNFDRCLEHVLKHEGGYVNHPRDPGGETNMGISKRSYPNEDIRNMTKARAGAIYRRDFWDKVKCDDLPMGVDLVVFDAAVNSGPSRSAKWLQSACDVRQDGVVGPNTVKAANMLSTVNVINRALMHRLAFLQSLATWATFGRGWQSRVDNIRRAALDMADDPLADTVSIEKHWLQTLIEALAGLFRK